MRVANSEIAEQGDIVEVSAEIDGFRLWYRIPKSYQVSRSGDAFLASALLPAMRQGEKLDIDPNMPVSPKFLRNVSLLQEIFYTWNPKELKIVPVSASTSPAKPLNTGAISFFSGGVDSTHTFLKHRDEISHAVFMHGFDFYANRKVGSALLVGDLRDLSQFAFRLTTPYSALYAFLKGGLSKTTLEALSDYQVSGKDPGRLETGLIKDLNTLITGRSIYEAQRFQDISLRPQTQQLLAQNPKGKELGDLNRLLLEDACPLEISGKFTGEFQTAIERNSRFVQRFGKTLLPIEHNHYAFGYRYNLSRNLTQGSVLGSVAQLLGFPLVFIPSSFTYCRLAPLGSHPLTDPLWSNECMEIIHDGADLQRKNKIRKIAEQEQSVENLRVCFNDMNVNCGKCSKCLRTMLPLKLLRVSTTAFPPLPPARAILKNHFTGDGEVIFLKENLELAAQTENVELQSVLSSCLRRLELRRLFAEIDRLVFNGIVKRMRRRMVKFSLCIRRINSIPLEE